MKGFDSYRYTVDTPRGYFWRGPALIHASQVTPEENKPRPGTCPVSVTRFVRTKRRAMGIIRANPACELGRLVKWDRRKDRKWADRTP